MRVMIVKYMEFTGRAHATLALTLCPSSVRGSGGILVGVVGRSPGALWA